MKILNYTDTFFLNNNNEFDINFRHNPSNIINIKKAFIKNKTLVISYDYKSYEITDINSLIVDIPTAREAREKVKNGIAESIKEDLNRIAIAINQKINSNETVLWFYKIPNDIVINKLESLGYKVTKQYDQCDQCDSNCIKIEW